jgi:hypothetical protein
MVAGKLSNIGKQKGEGDQFPSGRVTGATARGKEHLAQNRKQLDGFGLLLQQRKVLYEITVTGIRRGCAMATRPGRRTGLHQFAYICGSIF